MNKPSSLSALSRHRSSEHQLLAIAPVEFRADTSEKQLALLNPFSLPGNDPDLYHQREFERIEEEKYRKAIKYYPIQERHAFTQANSMLKDMKRDTIESEGLLPSVGSRRHISSKKETIKEFIQRKREILLVKKNIENKKAKYSELEDEILRKLDKHKANKKKLEDNKGRVDKYEEQLKLEADFKAKQAEDKANKRNEKQKELKTLQDEIESLTAIVERTIEEQKSLEDYKEFIDELIPEIKTSIFLTDGRSPTEIYAKQVEEGINSLETTNLFQIQQAQEDEQELEILRHQNNQLKFKEMKRCSDMKNTVHSLEAQKKVLEEKLKKISAAEEIEMPVDESSSKRIYHELELLYEVCGWKNDNHLNELEMLESIEKAFEICLKDKDKKEKVQLKRKEKEIERERRMEKIDQEREKSNQKTLEINRKIEIRKKKVAKKAGRKDMKRSKLHEKVEIFKPPDEPQEVLDRREFLESNN